MAETIASGIVDRVQRLGVDGVDFMQAKGCGIRNMRCDDQTSTHLFLLELIRKKMPKGKYKYLFRIYTKKYSLLYVQSFYSLQANFYHIPSQYQDTG